MARLEHESGSQAVTLAHGVVQDSTNCQTASSHKSRVLLEQNGPRGTGGSPEKGNHGWSNTLPVRKAGMLQRGHTIALLLFSKAKKVDAMNTNSTEGTNHRHVANKKFHDGEKCLWRRARTALREGQGGKTCSRFTGG